MINFDLSFFFKEGINIQKSDIYKKNLEKASSIGKSLINDYHLGKNEILKTFTKEYQNQIRNLRANINFGTKMKVIIGLGGSSSGAKAISHYISDNIIYFDNLDYSYIDQFLKKNSVKNCIFFLISKSGDTFETLAITNLIISYAIKIGYHDIYKSIIAVTENKNSLLKKFIDRNNIKFIEHNSRIGGRFSILSETGLLPFLDLKIKVEDSSEKYLNLLNDTENNSSPIKNAAIIFTCIEKYNLNIYCNLLYNYKLKHFSYWFHQLHAETLGKNKKGLTPITSICPKDHHSMMQLYLDGPKDKFFNIFSPQDEVFFDRFGKLGFSNIEKYSPQELLVEQFKSVVNVFNVKDIPCRIINISDHKNPQNILELFSYFLLETLVLAQMSKVNPYDQPSVELIKKNI